MNSYKATIKYDGPIIEEKGMDVADLAPSLLALSDLVKETNNLINEGRTNVKILVSADLKNKCFELNIEVIQNLWEQAKILLGDEDIKAAKELFQWIMLGTASGCCLIALCIKLKNKYVDSTKFIQKNGETSVEISIRGEKVKEIIPELLYRLYNQKIS